MVAKAGGNYFLKDKNGNVQKVVIDKTSDANLEFPRETAIEKNKANRFKFREKKGDGAVVDLIVEEKRQAEKEIASKQIPKMKKRLKDKKQSTINLHEIKEVKKKKENN